MWRSDYITSIILAYDFNFLAPIIWNRAPEIFADEGIKCYFVVNTGE
jgi:hypothetical protein